MSGSALAPRPTAEAKISSGRTCTITLLLAHEQLSTLFYLRPRMVITIMSAYTFETLDLVANLVDLPQVQEAKSDISGHHAVIQ